MSHSRNPISVSQGIIVGLVGLGVCFALWLTLGRNPDQVDSSVKVERGAGASTEPNPDYLMMQEHMKRQGK